MDFTNFSDLSPEQRLAIVKEKINLTAEEKSMIAQGNALSLAKADTMVENVIGTYQMPYAIAPNFVINNKNYLVPMVGEEPYVNKSICNGALLAKNNGGFIASNTGSIMIGQIQLTGIPNPYTAKMRILEEKKAIMELADSRDPVLISFGGGCINVEVRILDSLQGPMVITHLLVDTKDAMGAQVVNAMAEAAAPLLEKITGGKANLKVLSNLAVHRLVRSRVSVKKEHFGGEANVDKILSAYAFAAADPYRATTNNKGVMNGMIPVVLATGNDTRAVESGVHAYASISGTYKPVTVWEKNSDGNLEGMIEVPMAVGIVGGTTKVHPLAQLSLKIMDIKSAPELAQVIATVGLAANLSVLNSLTTVGLYSDFNKSHARSK